MDRETFASRVSAMETRLYRMASAYLHGEHDRLDAISDAILKAWQKQYTLKNEAYFETWLTRILIRECIDAQRKQKRMIPTEQIPDRMDESTGGDAGYQLRWALNELPEKFRLPLLLHYMENYGVDEIARILSISRGAVCSRLARGREKLKILLKEEIE